MIFMLRRPFAEVEQEFPGIYADWRTQLDLSDERRARRDVTSEFGGLFLEQFWSCRDELYDVLQSQNVIAVFAYLLPINRNRVDVLLQAMQVHTHANTAPFVQTYSETLRGKKHPRQSDLLAACRRLGSLLHTHPNDASF